MGWSAMSELKQLTHYTKNKPLVQVELNKNILNCCLITDS